jgi:NAD(P)-dependent dehydrogenase (short-subunit alcohol dehydrogenase family)
MPKPAGQRRLKPPFPARKLDKPGIEAELEPRPSYLGASYKAAGKLVGKRALITGGDSGIGRAVAVLFAREGADVAITYLPEEQSDAEETQRAVEATGRTCVLIAGDLTRPAFCRRVVDHAVKKLGGLDILVSNAAHQNRKTLDDLTPDEFDRTFKTNMYAYYYLARHAVPKMKPGSSIIATSSSTSFAGSEMLPDYSATKGAINQFTKVLAKQLVDKGIRVNAVAPGPVWTPLNPADRGLPAKEVARFGEHTPLGRPAQPDEIAPAYVFLASEADSSYITGIILPILGGETIGG